MFNPNEHLSKLKGKDYLEVKWRLVWFRDEHPDWCINTDLVSVTDNSAVFKAEIMEPNTEHIVSTGYGSETANDFHDFLEKAETKAVGRALAMLGYGTQFAPEMEEENRIVDSPVERKPNPLDFVPSKSTGKFPGMSIRDILNQPDGRDYLEQLLGNDAVPDKVKNPIRAAIGS